MERHGLIVRRKVYLIESDDSIRDGVAMLADTTGFEVESYASAEAFLDGHDARSAQVPARIVCAAELPGMGGLMLYRRLRARGDERPFALLLGRNNEVLRSVAVGAGIETIITKPHADAALLEFIHRPG